jgi:hypothetical protein
MSLLPVTQGAGNPAAFGSCRGGIFLWASAPSMISPPMSYRLDCRHYVGSGKDSDEQEVAMHQRKTAAKSTESRKHEQFPRAWLRFTGSFHALRLTGV